MPWETRASLFDDQLIVRKHAAPNRDLGPLCKSVQCTTRVSRVDYSVSITPVTYHLPLTTEAVERKLFR